MRYLCSSASVGSTGGFHVPRFQETGLNQAKIEVREFHYRRIVTPPPPPARKQATDAKKSTQGSPSQTTVSAIISARQRLSSIPGKMPAGTCEENGTVSVGNSFGDSANKQLLQRDGFVASRRVDTVATADADATTGSRNAMLGGRELRLARTRPRRWEHRSSLDRARL